LKEFLFHRLDGQEARRFVQELAELRLKVFFDFPYLYEGNLDYEKHYLETYFQAKHSFIFLVEHEGKIIGATTGIWAKEEEDNFRRPFENNGMDPEKIFYFGESILLPEYRGKGLGKVFFEEREKFARSLPFIETLSFCSVLRDENHPLKPDHYQPLDNFWMGQGFLKAQNLTTQYEWQDREETVPSFKNMQYWIKNLK